MNCNEFEKLVSLYIDKELPEDKQAKLEEHLTTCSKCRELLEEFKALESGAREIHLPVPEEDYWKNFAFRLKTKLTVNLKPSFREKLKNAVSEYWFLAPAQYKWASTIAVFILMLGVNWLYFETQKSKLSLERNRIIELERSLQKQETPITTPEKAIPALGKPVIEKKLTGKQITNKGLPLVTQKKEPKSGISKPSQALFAPETKAPAPAQKESQGPPAVTSQQELAGDRMEDKPVAETARAQEGLTEVMASIATVEKDATLAQKSDSVSQADYNFTIRQDSLYQIEYLKKKIDLWESYLKQNPTDTLSEKTYLQILDSYVELYELTQDSLQVQEALQKAMVFKNQTPSEAGQQALQNKILQLQSLLIKK